VNEGPGHRRDADVRDHLDRQGVAEHRARVGARQFVGEQAERDGGEAGAEQRQYLRQEQASVDGVS
jgi:hypothetical protein